MGATLHPPRVFQPKQEERNGWMGKGMDGSARENWKQRAAQQRQEHIPPENDQRPSTGTQQEEDEGAKPGRIAEQERC